MSPRPNLDARLRRLAALKDFKKETSGQVPFRGFTWTAVAVAVAVGAVFSLADPAGPAGAGAPLPVARGGVEVAAMDENGFFRPVHEMLGVLTPFEYEVKSGETLDGLAGKFAVKPETLRWANPQITSEVAAGDLLVVPPVDGVLHHVEKGETIGAIAKAYDVETAKIETANDPDFLAHLSPGSLVVVPGAAPLTTDAVSPEQKFVVQKAFRTPALEGSMIVPTAGVYTQFFHAGHRGVDIATPVGTEVYAARAGTVLRAATSGYNAGYGRFVLIDHGGGLHSRYAHLSKVEVKEGDRVVAGAPIAETGNSGRSTGPHLHFEVIQDGVARNPQLYF